MNDFEGKVILKVKMDDEIKKLVIHNDDLTYNEVVLMIQRIFSLSQNDEFTIKYTDEDNDLITIASDMDVLLAIQSCKVLKLTLFMRNNDKKLSTSDPTSKVNSGEIISELKTIRESIDRFVNKMEILVKQQQSTTLLPDSTSSNINEQKLNIENHKEFDPLAKTKEQQQQQQQQQPQQQQRTETPDSIASGVGFNKPPQMQQLSNSSSMPVYAQQPSFNNSSTQSPYQRAQVANNPLLNNVPQQQFQTFQPPQSQIMHNQQQPHHQQQQQQQPPPQQQQQQQQPNQFGLPTPPSLMQQQAQPSMFQQQPSSIFQQQPLQSQQQQAPPQQPQGYNYYGPPPPSSMATQANQSTATNPYSRSSNAELQRPPSALYQQAYK